MAPKRAKAQLATLSDLAAAPYNPRTIGAKALAGLGYSLAEFGDLSGITVNERTGHLVAGHQRVKSLRAQYGDLAIDGGAVVTPEGHTFAVRVVDWPLKKEKAANVAANATTIQGEFTADLDALVAEVSADMPDVAAALALDDLVAEVLADTAEREAADESLLNAAEVEEDEAPSVDEQGPVHSKQGVVYELGPHRLLCGDCRDPANWPTLLQGRPANLVFTSPPYASQRKYDESSGFKPIPPDEYGDWWAPLQAAVRAHLAGDGSFFVNIKEHCQDGQRHLYVKKLTIRMVEAWGWRFVDELCWYKPNGSPTEAVYALKNQWEPVLCFTDGAVKIDKDRVRASVGHVGMIPTGPTVRRLADHGNVAIEKDAVIGVALPGNVINVPTRGEEGETHAAAFPVGLPSFFVRAYTDPGDLVVDPFMGSGTTMIAAEQHGRHAAGFEISPRYCDVIRRRWTAYATKNDKDPGPGALE